MRAVTPAILMMALGLAAAPAAAGVIRGVLVAGPPGRAGVRDAVVYLEHIPDKVEHGLESRTTRTPAKPTRMLQTHLEFVPRVLVTTAGVPVEFQNLDRVYHNAFSISAAKRFDLGKYPPGAIDTVVFDRVGVANLHCDIHPDESAFVVVVPNHAFARPDSIGRFALPKMPKGQYRVRVWHPRLGEISRAVEMPRRGDVALELKF